MYIEKPQEAVTEGIALTGSWQWFGDKREAIK